MADNFGLKIGVEGEKEFKKALADINSQFKVLGSEMKLATSQFESNERSVESLTSKNEVLTKQIDAQKEKIETLRKALENASDSFGENDRRTQQWVVALNNAEAELPVSGAAASVLIVALVPERVTDFPTSSVKVVEPFAPSMCMSSTAGAVTGTRPAKAQTLLLLDVSVKVVCRKAGANVAPDPEARAKAPPTPASSRARPTAPSCPFPPSTSSNSGQGGPEAARRTAKAAKAR